MIIDPVGLISIDGLFPHVPSQFTELDIPFPGVIVITRQTSKQILFVVHAIDFSSFLIASMSTICMKIFDGTAINQNKRLAQYLSSFCIHNKYFL